jgi:methionine-rich copper-binding protein CopC
MITLYRSSSVTTAAPLVAPTRDSSTAGMILSSGQTRGPTVRSFIGAAVVGVVGGLLLVGIAYAHAAYVRSNPGADAIVATPPGRVDIWFAQELFRRQGENTIHVTASDGQEVSVGETMIDDDDRKHIWVNLKPNLPAGVYAIAWKNVSLEDGHPSQGAFSFTIDPQAAATSTPMGTPTPIGRGTPKPAASEAVVATISPTQPPAAVPTKSPQTSSPCGLGTAPVAGLAAYVAVKRSRRKRSGS